MAQVGQRRREWPGRFPPIGFDADVPTLTRALIQVVFIMRMPLRFEVPYFLKALDSTFYKKSFGLPSSPSRHQLVILFINLAETRAEQEQGIIRRSQGSCVCGGGEGVTQIFVLCRDSYFTQK